MVAETARTRSGLPDSLVLTLSVRGETGTMSGELFGLVGRTVGCPSWTSW